LTDPFMKRLYCKSDKIGLTLVEVVIAASIMSMLIYFVYQLFFSFARSQDVGHWSLTTTSQLRNGLTLLRNELTRVTKPEVVTQKGSKEFITGNGDQEKFLYVPGTMPFSTENVSTNQRLMHFYMCRPGRQDLPGESNIAPEIISGQLFLEGGKLKYRRIIESQPAAFHDKISELHQTISEHISKIEITTKEIDASDELSVKNRNFIVITLSARHPRYVNSVITESIEAPFEVDVKSGGFP